MLFGSLVELHACLHSYLCFSLLEKLFLSNLDSFSTPDYLSSFSTSSYRNLDSFSTARWIDRDFFWILDSFLTTGRSIELSFSLLLICPSTDPRELHLSTPFLLDTWLDRCLDTSQHLYLSRFTDLLYKSPAQSGSHFFRSLSR